MLLLVFTAAESRYALSVERIREITPMVVFREIAGAPESVRGLMNYRGDITPVIDLTSLLAGRRSRNLLSTRIIVVDYDGVDGETHALGLVAERVTDTAMTAPEAMQPPGIEVEDAPYLVGAFLDRQGMVQLVDPARLLPKPLREALFHAPSRPNDAA